MRLVKSTAEAKPQPHQTTINQAGPNYAAALVIILSAIPAFLWLGWLALVGLFEVVGAEKPARAAAQGLIILFILAIVLIVAVIVGQWLLARYFDYRIQLEQVRGEWQYKQLMVSREPVGNSRTMGEDVRFVRLVETVMIDAYDHVLSHGQYTKTDSKPWSRENAKQIKLTGESDPVGWAMGAKVRPWLQNQGIVKGDKINLKKFPDIGSVQNMLRLQFETPISPAALRENSGYEFIKST